MSQIIRSGQPEDRLSIRASLSQKEKLRRAAEARHTTMSQFVLESSLRAADEILMEESTLVVSAEEYGWICSLMDNPTRDLTELRVIVNQKPVWHD